jgi:excisionase family DNA binding protein
VEQISVEQAAEHLGVSRMQVGRLIENGDLLASRFGRAWVIDRDSLQRYAAARPGRGRPLSAAAAWQRLSNAHADSIDDLRRLANQCRRRAVTVPVRVLPGELDAAIGDERIVLGGADAAIAHKAAVGQPSERVAYIRASCVEGFLGDHFASHDALQPNLVLRVVVDEVWPFEEERFVSPLVAAIDLVDVGDVRSAAEAIR